MATYCHNELVDQLKLSLGTLTMILQCLIEYQTHMDIIHCEINETLCCPKEANSFAQSESASFHSFKVAGLEILLLIHIVDCFPPEHHNY